MVLQIIILLFLISSSYEAVISSNSIVTFYWTLDQNDFTGVLNTQLKTCQGQTLATVELAFAQAIRIEGSGLLRDGRLINLGNCGCGGGFSCFMEIDTSITRWGFGSQDNPLQLFISVAANDIPFGTKIYVPKFDGIQLPSGITPSVHNGCFRLDDSCSTCGSKHIGIFISSIYIIHA